jgi:hypothetical protein
MQVVELDAEKAAPFGAVQFEKYTLNISTEKFVANAPPGVLV